MPETLFAVTSDATPARAETSPAGKLLAMAEALVPKIERLRASRLENTPKRQCQGMSARCEAANLERVRRACVALAEGWALGILPPEFQKLRTRTAIEPLVTRQIEHPSYYVVRESDQWRSMDPLAVKLRAYVADTEGAAGAARDREEARAAHVRKLEEAIRFTPIEGFFPTPPALIAEMIDRAELRPGMKVLEPSAGKGDIMQAVLDAGAGCCGIELVPQLAELCKAKGLAVDCGDFLTMKPIPVLDRVLMNPPFERGQDMEHVRRAFDWLKPGGRIVAIVGAGYTFRADDRAHRFRQWLDQEHAAEIKNDPDAFRSAFRSTSVQTYTLIIDK